MSRTRWAGGAAALGVAVLLTASGCGSGSGSGTEESDAADKPAASSGVDPNAPEPADAGDIPDNQQFVPYTPPSGLFTVKVPEGWSRTDGTSTVTFTDKLNSVRADVAPAPAAPTEATVRAELGKIRDSGQGYAAGSVKSVTRRGGRALLATYRLDAAPDAVTGKVRNDDVERYEFWKDGQLVTVTLSGPHGADNVDPWRIVTDSFRWGR